MGSGQWAVGSKRRVQLRARPATQIHCPMPIAQCPPLDVDSLWMAAHISTADGPLWRECGAPRVVRRPIHTWRWPLTDDKLGTSRSLMRVVNSSTVPTTTTNYIYLFVSVSLRCGMRGEPSREAITR